MSMAEQNAATMRRSVQEVQSQGQIGLVDDYLSPDFVERTPFPGAGVTRATT
jgi:hypothetical protein